MVWEQLDEDVGWRNQTDETKADSKEQKQLKFASENKLSFCSHFSYQKIRSQF
jgi:hypothetical protein